MVFEDLSRKNVKPHIINAKDKNDERQEMAQASKKSAAAKYDTQPTASKSNNLDLLNRLSLPLLQPRSPATVIFSDPSEAGASAASSSSSKKRSLKERISTSKLGQLFSRPPRSTTPLLDQKLQAFYEQREADEKGKVNAAKHSPQHQYAKSPCSVKFGLSTEMKGQSSDTSKIRGAQPAKDGLSDGAKKVVDDGGRHSFDEQDEDRMRGEDGTGITGVSVVIHRTNREDLVIKTPFVID